MRQNGDEKLDFVFVLPRLENAHLILTAKSPRDKNQYSIWRARSEITPVTQSSCKLCPSALFEGGNAKSEYLSSYVCNFSALSRGAYLKEDRRMLLHKTPGSKNGTLNQIFEKKYLQNGIEKFRAKYIENERCAIRILCKLNMDI